MLYFIETSVSRRSLKCNCVQPKESVYNTQTTLKNSDGSDVQEVSVNSSVIVEELTKRNEIGNAC